MSTKNIGLPLWHAWKECQSEILIGAIDLTVLFQEGGTVGLIRRIKWMRNVTIKMAEHWQWLNWEEGGVGINGWETVEANSIRDTGFFGQKA